MNPWYRAVLQCPDDEDTRAVVLFRAESYFAAERQIVGCELVTRYGYWLVFEGIQHIGPEIPDGYVLYA